MINVTKPFLPSQDEYERYLKKIWDNNWLTNNGPLVNELELKLKEYLGLEHLLFLSNGTIALQIAIKALDLRGEIITTPFSYVATTSCITWEGCKPVFVDIDSSTLNIDPQKIEEAITDQTTGILATHVYGNPCDVDAIEQIAQKHNLKVIYDAAHCFGTLYKGKSVLEYGDISTISFHATKIFHTIEGGAVVTKNAELLRRMSLLRNFGHTSPTSFDGVGINAKNSEFHAAMGLANFQNIDNILNVRQRQYRYYKNKLENLQLQDIKIVEHGTPNFSYYPIIFQSEELLQKSLDILVNHLIYPRRYFYPSLNTIDYVDYRPAPIAEDIAKKVLCLPLYHGLKEEEMDMIIRLLFRAQKY